MAHLDVHICTVMLKGRYYTNSFSIVQVNTETAGFKNHITADMELASFCYKQLLLQTYCKPEQVSLHVLHVAHKCNG